MTPRPWWRTAVLCPYPGIYYHPLPKPCRRILSWHHICNSSEETVRLNLEGKRSKSDLGPYCTNVSYKMTQVRILYLSAPDVRRIIKRRRDFQELLKLIQYVYGIRLELIAVNYVQVIMMEIVQPPFDVQCIFSRVQTSKISVQIQ